MTKHHDKALEAVAKLAPQDNQPTQHTQGEWELFEGHEMRSGDDKNHQIFINENDAVIVPLACLKEARLIAAAPETAAERDRLKVELANAKKSRDGYQCRLVDERALSAKLLEALERNLFDLEWCQKNHVHPDNSLAVAIENTRAAISLALTGKE